MVGAKTLYRSHRAVLGGVCSGLAEYFALDTAVVRALVVALVVLTAGFAVIVYAALWLILPQAPRHDAVVDVAPESVHSEARGCRVDAGAAPRPAPAPPAASSGIGHIPPTPPRGARAASAARVSASAHCAPAPHAATAAVGRAPVPSAAPGPGPCAPPCPCAAPASGRSGVSAAPSAAPEPAASPAGAPGSAPAGARPVREASVRIMLFIGMTLLFAGFAGFFSALVSEVRWWQFWPAMLVIVGVVALVVPPQEGSERGWAVTVGVVAFAAGVWMLAFSLGFVSWESLRAIVDNLWPLFFVMAGFFVMAVSARSSGLALCGAAAFAAFCVLGLAWFALPGDLSQATLQLPGKVLVMPNPWM